MFLDPVKLTRVYTWAWPTQSTFKAARRVHDIFFLLLAGGMFHQAHWNLRGRTYWVNRVNMTKFISLQCLARMHIYNRVVVVKTRWFNCAWPFLVLKWIKIKRRAARGSRASACSRWLYIGSTTPTLCYIILAVKITATGLRCGVSRSVGIVILMWSFDERFDPADMDGLFAAIVTIRCWLKGFHNIS